MRVFLSALLILTRLLCLSLPGNAAAHDRSGVGVNSKGEESSSDTIKSDSSASSMSSLNIINGLRDASLSSALRITRDIQVSGTPEPSQPSSPDFWELVQRYENIARDYVPRLLEDAAVYFESNKFTDIMSTMHDIVCTSATFRDGIQGALDTHHITLDVLAEDLERIFTEVVQNLENIPLPDKASGHAKRAEMLDQVLDDAGLALTNLVPQYGIDEEVVTAYLTALRPQVHALITVVGDINEQYPELFPTLAFSVVVLLIPESWILRPLLRLFGFGPLGPVKGSAAAWLQMYFWGAAVKSGSWFAMLQAAGMGVLPVWAGLVTKLTLWFGGVWGMFSGR